MNRTCVAVSFDDLELVELHAVMKLRQDVFILEQRCLYPDLDGRDTEPGTRHVLLLTEEHVVLGYARVLDDGEVWRIGRVVVDPQFRGRRLAEDLVDAAVRVSIGRPVVLDAQAGLESWYVRFGFTRSGPEFVEDGIPHVPMRKEPA